MGRARVQLSADFDFNKITQTSDKFDPEGRVLRSSQTREESSASGADNGQVTVNNELPGNQQQQCRPRQPRDQSKKTEETNNYEISRTTKTEVTEAGRVNRISVAVLVDGAYTKNDKGELVYKERSKDELDRISALVRSAIGFDQKRGDQVEVVNLKFAEGPQVGADPGADRLPRHAAVHQGRHHVRHRARRHDAARPRRAVHGGAPAGQADPGFRGARRAHQCRDRAAGRRRAGRGRPRRATAACFPATTPPSHMIDVAQVQGQVHAQSMHRVGELAERNPNETVAIVRQWLSEPAAE